MVTLTIERCHIIINPYKPKPTRKHALIVATVSAIIVLVISIQAGFMYNLSTSPMHHTVDNMVPFYNLTDNQSLSVAGSERICKIAPGYEEYFQKVYGPTMLLLLKLIDPIIVISYSLSQKFCTFK